MPFEKGKSGNPGGKNPEREALRRYLFETYGKESIDGIADMAKNARSEKVRLDAKVWLSEQAIGRALVAVSGEDGGPLEVSAPALLDVLRALVPK